MGWRRMKGMLKAVNRCPSCGGLFPDEDYSFEDDMCLSCLFPQMGDKRPADINDLGQNVTKEREMLDNLDYIPEKQSKASQKAFSEYKMRTYSSKKGNLYK